MSWKSLRSVASCPPVSPFGVSMLAGEGLLDAYAAITGQYAEFPNLCFVDTLDNVGLHTSAIGTNLELFGGVTEENVARIRRQNARKISVIIGNPPYNANQANENDNNKNREYPAIDARIKQTYIHESTAQKTKLYDMYARFYRWELESVAFRWLSVAARALLLELKALYTGSNNGSLFLSVREGARRLGIGKN